MWKAVRVPSREAQTRAGWLGLKPTEVTTSVLVFSRARGARTYQAEIYIKTRYQYFVCLSG